MTTHSQKFVKLRLEVGPETGDGKSLCEVLLDKGTSETVLEVEKISNVFSRGIECGMFCLDSNTFLIPKFHLVEHSVSSDQNQVTWHFEGIHVGHAAYCALINLLRRIPSSIPAVLSVRINVASNESDNKVEENALSTFLPLRASHLPFKLEDDVTDPPQKQTVIMIYSLDDLSEEVMVRVSDALDAWRDFVIAGGLYNKISDNSEKRGVVMLIEHYQIGTRSIECSIFGLEFPSGVVDTLVNVLAFLHEKVAKIDSVEMD